ncbi:MAG TPA: ribonuclease H-like domain-containing protein [Candidatus Hydrogenedentes bacterium]|nr:ribonuclease H-like domain-containing protein [Candidatus Hydrogenedentota bacterium]
MDVKKLEQLRRMLNLKTGAELGSRKADPDTPPDSSSGSGSPKKLSQKTAAETDKNTEERQLLRKRMRAILGVGQENSVRTVQEETVNASAEICGELEGNIIRNKNGSFLLVRREFPVEWRHGTYPLGAVLHCSPQTAAWISGDLTLSDMNWRETLFLDTETTGLAGGAGTVCFLIGIGKFISESVFRLDQCFMRDFDDEGAMLTYLDSEYPAPSALVSYNGKSFDLPLLRNRHVQHRLDFPWKHTPHFDLVHSVRRIWKRRLEDCGLANVERLLLGVTRTGDVPSSLIPRIWLDFITRGDPRPLRPVFYHHRVDILSMVTLAGCLSRMLEDEAGRSFEEAEDRVSLLRQCIKKRDYERAVQVAEAMLHEEDFAEVLGEVHELRCTALRRLKRASEYMDALWAWHRACPTDLRAAYFLAGVMANARNLAAARQVCEETLEKVESAGSFYRDMAIQPDRLKLEDRLRHIRARMGSDDSDGSGQDLW